MSRRFKTKVNINYDNLPYLFSIGDTVVFKYKKTMRHGKIVDTTILGLTKSYRIVSFNKYKHLITQKSLLKYNRPLLEK